MLRELKSLFQAFDICPVGNLGKRTIDPTGLRVALAQLDAKRFAAGAWLLSRHQYSTSSQAEARLELPSTQMLMPEDQQAGLWQCNHPRALAECSRGLHMQGR